VTKKKGTKETEEVIDFTTVGSVQRSTTMDLGMVWSPKGRHTPPSLRRKLRAHRTKSDLAEAKLLASIPASKEEIILKRLGGT